MILVRFSHVLGIKNALYIDDGVYIILYSFCWFLHDLLMILKILMWFYNGKTVGKWSKKGVLVMSGLQMSRIGTPAIPIDSPMYHGQFWHGFGTPGQQQQAQNIKKHSRKSLNQSCRTHREDQFSSSSSLRSAFQW